MQSANGGKGERVTQRGLGLPVAAPEGVIHAAAVAVEENNYHSFWLNNPPGSHALAVLGDVSGRASAIWLGVGVIPLSAVSAQDIIRQARSNNVPLERLYLGIGSGSAGIDRVAGAIHLIKTELNCQLVLAALGPRMCRLAGTRADAVLLNWLTPEFARRSIEWVRESAQEAGKPTPRLMAYVRAALGEVAIARLRKEAGNYESIPQYSSHFKRMGVSAMDTTVTGATEGEIQEGLAVWNGIVDEVVVRAVPEQDTVDEVRRIIFAARPVS